MIIGNDDFDKENPHSDEENSPSCYLLPETEIRDFVEDLRFRKSHQVTLRLIAAALAIIESMQNRIDGRSNRANLLLVRQMAREENNKRYRQLMEAVASAIEPGRERFDSAYLTVARALEYVYESLPQYSKARRFYAERLEEISKKESE